VARVKWIERRRQRAQLAIIGALHQEHELAGWPLMQRTGLSAGRLYVALSALEQDGKITSRWQDGPRPRRRLYRLVRFNNGGPIR
jgi:DNA-binding PadR family transcriptional regulator